MIVMTAKKSYSAGRIGPSAEYRQLNE